MVSVQQTNLLHESTSHHDTIFAQNWLHQCRTTSHACGTWLNRLKCTVWAGPALRYWPHWTDHQGDPLFIVLITVKISLFPWLHMWLRVMCAWVREMLCLKCAFCCTNLHMSRRKAFLFASKQQRVFALVKPATLRGCELRNMTFY